MPLIVGTFKDKELVAALKNAPVGSTTYSIDIEYTTVYIKNEFGYWQGRKAKYRSENFLFTATPFIVTHPYIIAEELE